MTLEELSALLDTTQRDLFRIETLASYDTAATTSEYRRWLANETEPDWELRRPWLNKLTQWAEQGRPRRRVRLIHDPIAQYERYACDWSYPSSVAAGELIQVLDLGEVQPPNELRDAPGDWYLIDGRDTVKMHYDAESRFVGAERIDAQHIEIYRSAADAVWVATEPFTRWWGRHPEYQRNTNQPVR